MPESKVIKYLLQMCLGVHFLHNKGFLHRDLKALNIFMTKQEEAKIGDLGLAKAFD